MSAKEIHGQETVALLAANEKATVLLLEAHERTASESAMHVLAAAELLIAAQEAAAGLLVVQGDENAATAAAARDEATALLRREGAVAVALLREHETEDADALMVAQREAAAILLEAGMATQDGRDARLDPKDRPLTARLAVRFQVRRVQPKCVYGALVPVWLVLLDPPIMFPGP